jgi:hypothetical protein
MAIGVLNPSDSSHTPSVRPTRTNTGVNQRRWFSNSMSTEVRDQDLNDILAQIRYAIDYYSVLDVEGDDSLLQQAIAVGASSLTGNLAQLQAIVGGANKVPYWISGSAMGTFTATSYSRSLFAMTNQTQWRDALGISAIESDNLVAFGGLTASANTLGYFTGPGTMGLTNLTSAARGLLDDADVTAMRATLLLGSAALHPDTDFATPSDLALKANLASPSLTGVPTAPTAATSTNSTQLATTAYVKANIAALTTADIGGFTAAMALKADLASPALAGTPTAPTASTATNSTQIATTAYVKSNLTSYAPLASPALTGAPTAPTAASGTNTTQLATTAFVGSAISTASGSYQPLSANLTTLSGSSAFFLTLSDDANASVARATLGLGTAATHADTDFVVPTDLIPYAPLASPALTGTPTAPTASTATNTTQIASTAYVKNNLASYALLVSPSFTGTVNAEALTVNNGSLTVDRVGDAASSLLILKADAGSSRIIQGYTGVTARWAVAMGNNTAESGSNVGSNFAISRYDDAGVIIDIPLTIVRSTGIATFSVSPTAPTPAAGDNTTKLATTAFVKASYAPLASPTFTGTVTADTLNVVNGNISIDRTADAISAILQLKADSGFVRRIQSFTGTLTRWILDLGNSVAESGANAGTNFFLSRYDDSGALLDTPINIPRSTGIVAFASSPTAPTPSTADNTTKLATTAYVQSNLTPKAPLASPAFTGIPTAPTPTAGDNTTQLSTTAFVTSAISTASGSYQPLSANLTTLAASSAFFLTLSDDANAPTARTTLGLGTAATHAETDFVIPTDLAVYAPLASPALTGTPTAPTAANATNSTQIASTAFVQNNLAFYAPLASPALTGTPTAPTPATVDNTNTLATTSYVQNNLASYAPLASPVFTGTVTTDFLVANNGSITIDRTGDATTAALNMRVDAGQNRFIVGSTGTLNRWIFNIGTNAAETGANAGSNLGISRYDDAGTLIDAPLVITRSTGVVTFSQIPVGVTPTAGDNSTNLATTAFVSAYAPLASPALTGTPTAPTPTAGDNTTKLATTAFVKASFAPLASPALTGTATADALTVNNGNLIIDRTGDATTALLQIRADSGFPRRIQALTGTLNRWIMDLGNSTVESGANAGSNFFLSRYDDSGVLIDTPITIIRSSGQINVTTPMRASAGTVTAPGLQVGNDGNSGFFSDTADTFAIAINATECGRFLSGPKLIFGGTAAVNIGATTVIPIIQVNGILTNGFSIGVSAFNAGAGGPIFAGGKSRSGTTGVFGTAPIASDTLVEYRATADDTTTFVQAGSLRFLAKGDYSVVGTQNADFEVRVQSAGTLNTKFKVKAIGDLTDGSDNILIDSNRILRPRSYTVATLPAITVTGIIEVSDAFGGLGCQARSDGTSWRRVGDDAVLISATVSAYGTLSRMLGQPSYKLRKLIWNTQQKLIDAGLSAKLKGLWVHALPVQSDALINWITPGTRDMQIVGTPVFTANQGFTGDGTSALLNTVASFATFGAGQDDVAVGTYVLTASAASAAVIGRNTTTRTVYLNSFTSGALAARLNDSSADTFTPPRYTGLFTLSRTASTGFGAYLDDSLVATITRASTGNTGNITFLGTLDTAGSEFSTTKVAFSFISTGLTAADVKNLKRIMVDYFLMEVGAVSPSAINSPHPSSETYSVERWEIPASDMTGILTAAADRGARFAAYDFTVFDAFVGVTGAQSSSGVVTADVNKNGTSIFTTNPSIDALEYTSLTGTAGVLKTDGTQIFAKGDRISLDADASGTGASGLVATLIGYRTP